MTARVSNPPFTDASHSCRYQPLLGSWRALKLSFVDDFRMAVIARASLMLAVVQVGELASPLLVSFDSCRSCVTVRNIFDSEHLLRVFLVHT